MGYYTDYDFSNNRQEIIEKITEVCGYSSANGGRLCGVKWYDHDKHMKDVSKLFPNDVLVLEGDTGRRGILEDMWKAYYKDGKMQLCNAFVTFEPFDESKLV